MEIIKFSIRLKYQLRFNLHSYCIRLHFIILLNNSKLKVCKFTFTVYRYCKCYVFPRFFIIQHISIELLHDHEM